MKTVGNTVTKAEETLRHVRDGLGAGVEGSRDRAAGVLERAGGVVKSSSRRAARATERGGARVGDTFERTAKGLRPARGSSALGYLRSHPLQALLLLGLITGVVAVAFLPRLARRVEGEYGNFDELGPMA